MEDWPQSRWHGWYGRAVHPKLFSLRKYTPENPASIFVDIDALIEAVNDMLRNMQQPPPDAHSWALANIIAHELAHAASRGRVNHDNNLCLMYPTLAEHHLQLINNGEKLVYIQSPLDWLRRRKRTYRVPLSAWHEEEEIYRIREGIGLERLDSTWLQ